MVRTKSFLRREEYRRIAQLTLSGSILDVGGSKKSGYHELIGGEHKIVTANIHESYGTDLLFDAQEPWPLDDKSFDAVLFVNVLEHLYNYRTALSESVRVLRPGGQVIGVVPFMFNVHGSPSDHFRYTRYSLERLLTDTGYTDVRIEELGTGAFSVVYHTLLGFVRWQWLADVLIPIARSLDLLIARAKPNNLMGPAHMPLGYFFSARLP